MYTAEPSYGGFRKRPIKMRTYVFLILGIIILAGGLLIIAKQAIFEQSSVTVDLKITQLIQDTSKKNRGNAPEFEITKGEYAGKRYRSRLYSDPPLHEIGDLTKGQFDPVSGRIQSEKIISKLKLSSAIAALLGAIMVSFSFASYYRQSHRLSWRQ